jgi:glycosyltransferase involved in cell wall biosynthesis
MKPVRLLAFLEATSLTGPAKNLLEFARIARDQRFDPPIEVLIATFRRSGDSDVLLNAAERLGIPTYPIAERGRFDRSVLGSMQSLARELAPDIIQTHAVKSHFLIRRAGLDRTWAWVAFHHGYTWPNLRARVYNQLDRWSLPAARRIVTVSKAFRDELVRHRVAPERIAIVHNAIDPGWGEGAQVSAAALRAKLGIAIGAKVILSVGRLSREKDHATLLDALDQIRVAGQIVPHLVIVGDGPERSRIERRIQELKLAAHISMTGQQPSAEPYYGLADVAVLSSRSEGSPNALLEAMAAGVPLVATTVGGIPEMVTSGDSALLVHPADSRELAQALTAALTDRELTDRLTGRARQLVETRFSPGARAQFLCALYRDLVNPLS